MGILRVQHSLQDDSGLPEDQYVNTFFFITAGAPTMTDSNGGAALASSLFTAAIGGVGAPASFLSTQLSGLVKIKTYDMADPTPRTPINEYTDVYSVGSGSGVGLPSEVACCLSYAAAPVAGVPASRLRGRIYIGPLDSEAVVEGTDHHPVVNSVLLDRLTAGAENMASSGEAIGLTWALWSPTRAAASPIVRVWADNAFDTQRRRGNAATSRTNVIF